MVKSKKSANHTDSGIVTTDSIQEKKRTLVLDSTLSPLVCRKLVFDNKKYGNFNDNVPKKIVSHKKQKNGIFFDVEWEDAENLLSTKVNLVNVRKNCSDLLIDYLLTKL